MPLNGLVIQMKSGNDDRRAIKGCVVPVGSGAGIVCCCVMVHLDIEEGVNCDHFAAHVVGQFEYLRSDVDKERVGGPATENHDLGSRDVIDEERHRCTRADRLVSDLEGIKSEGGFASECVTCVPKDIEYVSVSDEPEFSIEGDRVDFGGACCIGYRA